ncbi:MAG: hypothetical protein HKO54_07065 [Flavobacteriaceae bacterium]|nr:hypothetical protein [Flavobacteriaceae bacterium]
MSRSNLNPYVGLRPYQASESLLFFGRDEQTLELLQRLHHHRFVAVVGSSGCGKSSLIRAGLIPALKGGYLIEGSNKWLIATMKPGRDPLRNLVQALLGLSEETISQKAIEENLQSLQEQGSSLLIDELRKLRKEKSTNVFLLVDQFEELFRFIMTQKDLAKRDLAIEFVNLILELSEQKEIPIYVVITMRSDFIGDCTQFRNLPEAMNRSQFLVPKLSRQELKKVIVGPATLYGGIFNSALTSKLLNAVGKVQDELPVLQHALMRMWDHETNTDKSGEIDLDDYRYIGGLEKALSQHADKAMEQLSSEEKKLAEILFKALTDTDDSGREIRRPLQMSDLIALSASSEKKLTKVINAFIEDHRSFLIVDDAGPSGDKNIDISHESLIRQWDTLKKWVQEEKETAEVYKQLAEANRLYRLDKRDPLTGSELQLGLEWREQFQPTAVWANRYREGFDSVMEYLSLSEEEAQRKDKKDKRRIKRQKIMAGLVMALLLSIAIVSTVSYNNASKVERSYDIHFMAQDRLATNPTEALMMELMADSIHPHPNDYFRATANQIYKTESFYKILPKGEEFDTGPIIYEFKKENDNYVLVDGKGNLIKKIDLEFYLEARMSNDKSHLLACCDKNMSAVSYDIEKDTLVSFIRPFEGAQNVLFAPELNRIVINGGTKGPINIYNKKGKLVESILPEFWGPLQIMEMDSVSRKLFISDGKRHELYDSVGRPIFNYVTEPKRANKFGRIMKARFSRNGTHLLTTIVDQATLWDMAGNKLAEFRGHTGTIREAEFSPDNVSIITAADDNQVILWNWNGKIIQSFKGHTDKITRIGFTKDGNFLKTESNDSTIRKWPLRYNVNNTSAKLGLKNTQQSINPNQSTTINHLDDVQHVAFHPTNDLVLSVTNNGDAWLWNRKGKLIKQIEGFSFGYIRSSAAFSPDGTKLVAGTLDQRTSVFTISGNELAGSYIFPGMDGINSIAFSQDSQLIACGSFNNKAVVKNLKGEAVFTMDYPNAINALAFLEKDNKRLVLSGFDRSWQVDPMNTAYAKLTNRFDFSDYITAICVSEDNQYIGVSSYDGSISIYQVGNDLSISKIHSYTVHKDGVSDIAFGPTSGDVAPTIATASLGGTAALWNMDGVKLKEFVGHAGSVNSVDFSPDGKLIITGSDDGSWRIWNAVPEMSLEDFIKSGNIETKFDKSLIKKKD